MLEIIRDPVPLTVNEHGQVMVAGTGVTLDMVIACYRRGDTPQEIAAGFPSVSLADVHAVIAYYLRHRAAVDAYLDDNARSIERLRADIQHIQGPQPTRQELHARRRQRRTDADLSDR